MEATKKFTIFLVFILLITSFAGYANAEVKGKEIKLSESTIVVTVNYLRGDELWANNTLSLVEYTLRLTEKVSGIPYPTHSPKNPYATENESKINIKICELTDNVRICEKGFGLEKTQDTTTTVRQIASLWNNYEFKRDWLSQGHTSLYTYLVLKEMNATIAEKFKQSLLLSYSNLRSDIDFPLDDWSFLESITSERQISKKNYGVAKSFVFMQLIYENYGNTSISDARKRLNKDPKLPPEVPDSAEYKKILENVTKKNLDDLFSGWVFPGEYKTQLEEIKEIETAMQKYNEVFEMYNKSKSKKLYEELTSLRTELYEKGDIEKSIEVADEILNRYKDVDVAVQKYNEVFKLCNKTQNKGLCEGLMILNIELYEKGDIEKSIEYSDELMKNYTASKNETINVAGYATEEDPSRISKTKYTNATKLYNEKGIFTILGIMFYDVENNLDKAKTELDKGNFEASIRYSDRATSDIEKANKFGMVIFIIILIIFIIFLLGLFLKR